MKNNKAKKKAAEKVEPKVVTKCDNLNEVTQNHDELITSVAQNSPESVSIKSMIRVIRGQKVMLDSDFTLLYGIKIRHLNEQFKRYVERFLNDFLFQLTYYLIKANEKKLMGMIMGAGQKSLNLQSILDLKCKIPTLAEQRTIVKYLDSVVAVIDEILKALKSDNNSFAEFRQTLIENVILGKYPI